MGLLETGSSAFGTGTSPMSPVKGRSLVKVSTEGDDDRLMLTHCQSLQGLLQEIPGELTELGLR